jgi:hypothetical protein
MIRVKYDRVCVNCAQRAGRAARLLLATRIALELAACFLERMQQRE